MSPFGTHARRRSGLRRAGRVGGLVLVVVAMVWSGAWIAGRVAIGDRLEAAPAMLAGQGVTLALGGHEIGGFPFAYTARFTDVAVDAPGGAGLSLPDLTARMDAGSPGRVEAGLPSRFTLALPGPGAAAARTLSVESENLVLAGEGLPGDVRTATLRADRLGLTGPGGLTVGLTGLDARLSRAQDGPAEIGGQARSLRFSRTLSGADGATLLVTGSLHDAALSGDAAGEDPAALFDLLSGRSRDPGRLSLRLSGARLDLAIRVSGAGAEQDGRLALSTGPASLRIALTDGVVRAGADVARGTLSLEAPGREIAGQIEIDPLTASYAAPFAPGEEMQPLDLSLEIPRAEPDRALWQAIDPGGRLPREALRLSLALSGTARVLPSPAASRPGAAPPIEPGNLTIERATLSGLGAAAEASGALEFARAGQKPTGAVGVTLDGVLELIRSLHGAELISQGVVQRLALALATHTRPGAEPGTLETEITFDNGRVSFDAQTTR